MPPLSPVEPKFRRRSAERPDEVLDAALALFSTQGFARTKVEDVAVRPGLSKAAVYLYFPSKRALLQGLVHRTVAGLTEDAIARMQAWRGDPRPLLALLLRQIAQRLAEPSSSSSPFLR